SILSSTAGCFTSSTTATGRVSLQVFARCFGRAVATTCSASATGNLAIGDQDAYARTRSARASRTVGTLSQSSRQRLRSMLSLGTRTPGWPPLHAPETLLRDGPIVWLVIACFRR